MKVLGHTVSPETEAACLARMRESWFTTSMIEDRAHKEEAPLIVCHLIADRLIQRERKAGNIVRRGKGWLPK